MARDQKHRPCSKYSNGDEKDIALLFVDIRSPEPLGEKYGFLFLDLLMPFTISSTNDLTTSGSRIPFPAVEASSDNLPLVLSTDFPVCPRTFQSVSLHTGWESRGRA